jgi:hypothetical protein
MSEQPANPGDDGVHPNADLIAIATATAAGYIAAWARLKASEQLLLETWFKLSPAGRRRGLSDIGRQASNIRSIGTDLADAHAAAIDSAWQLGQLTQVHLLDETAALADTSLDTLQSLVDDTTSALLDATTFVDRSTKAFIRTMTAEHINDGLVAGLNPELAASSLVDSLQGAQIAAVVYANGAQVGLDTYADMVTRTTVATAYQLGGIAQARSMGIEFFEIFDGPTCGWEEHDDPDLADGTIRTGDEAMAWPVSHPNCVRTSSARPDILTQDDADNATASTTIGQRIDQAHVSAERELAVARRAAAVAMSQQVERRANGILSDASNRVTSPAAARGIARRQLQQAKRARRVA